MPSEQQEIVAIALLTREDVRRIGTTLKVVFKADDEPLFDDLLKALDEADRAPELRRH